MDELGIMLYGYDGNDAAFIKNGLDDIMGQGVQVISGSGKESIVVGEILNREDSEHFSAGDPKVLMFLGFDDPQTGKAMDDFPKREDLDRPIFCSLTETNVKWTLRELIKDLLAEREYWRGKQGGGSKTGV